jgi:competence protein ComEC
VQTVREPRHGYGLMMRSRVALFVGIACCGLLVSRLVAQTGPPLNVTFIDVEGGQATLIVTASRESILIDAGYQGFNDRDADRIFAEAKRAGVSRIDYMIVTHYHRDHVGGVPALAARIPIGTFVDHGPTVEKGEQPDALFGAYVATREKGRHLQVKPGDRLPIAGLDFWIVASAGDLLTQALPGAGDPNPRCRDFMRKDDDPSENARSVGMLIGYGRFRMLDLGDLTWNKEHGLACPTNMLGKVDLYLTTHHGTESSGPAALVHAVAPRVAVMNNGAKKGGSREAWKIVRTSPGLEDFWQLHYAADAGPDHNVPERFIANPDESTAHAIRLTAYQDGRFSITNARNRHSLEYKVR